MKRRFCMMAAIVSTLFSCADSPTPLPLVDMHTDFGSIRVEVDTAAAPLTAANFLRYVDEGRLADAALYRTVRPDNQPDNDIRIEVLQGGLGFDAHPQRLPAIAHETTRVSGLRHLDGVISMARNAPGTASAEFFICIGNQPELDFGGRRNPDGQGFAAFGRVVSGMEIVRRIQQQADSAQMLREPVAITRVARAAN